MKKTTKKSSSKASHRRAHKNLDVTPAKGGTVRGGDKAGSGRTTVGELQISKVVDKSSAVLF
jgi:type VI protein secretion system component Hcp